MFVCKIKKEFIEDLMGHEAASYEDHMRKPVRPYTPHPYEILKRHKHKIEMKTIGEMENIRDAATNAAIKMTGCIEDGQYPPEDEAECKRIIGALWRLVGKIKKNLKGLQTKE